MDSNIKKTGDRDSHRPSLGRRVVSDRFGLPLDVGDVKMTAEKPTMRSLGVAPSAPPCLMSPSLSMPGLGPSRMPQGMGSMLPPSLINKEKSYASNVENVPAAVWKVLEGSVKPIPPGFLLEKTAALVPHVTASIVASRVSDCLRSRSISASYGDQKPKAKCRTMDGVEFRIRLFAGKGSYKHGIIVEVQRRSGWSITYQQDVTSILDSAKGKTLEVTSLVDDVVDSHHAPQDASSTQGGLCSLCKKLLTGKKTDEIMNGIKMLLTLTDGSKVGSNAALNNALMMVAYDEEIVDVLFGILHPESSNSNLRIFVLKVIKNCLNMTNDEDMLTKALLQNISFTEKLMTTLIHELKNADVNHNEAAIAAECIGKITESSREAALMACQLGARDVLIHAKEIGGKMHLHLETKACEAVKQMECF